MYHKVLSTNARDLCSFVLTPYICSTKCFPVYLYQCLICTSRYIRFKNKTLCQTKDDRYLITWPCIWGILREEHSLEDPVPQKQNLRNRKVPQVITRDSQKTHTKRLPKKSTEIISIYTYIYIFGKCNEYVLFSWI